MTSGHVVTLALGQVVTLTVCIFGVNRANCDTITKLGMCHLYSYQIHSVRLANRKSKMAAIFQDGHGQINVTLHEAGHNWPNSYNNKSFVCQNELFEHAEVSSECSIIPISHSSVTRVTCLLIFLF